MKDALLRLDNFDCFIVDEGDESVLGCGIVYDQAKKRHIGFWDMFSKRSIFLTATISYDLEDALYSHCGLPIEKMINFGPMIRSMNREVCSIPKTP